MITTTFPKKRTKCKSPPSVHTHAYTQTCSFPPGIGPVVRVGSGVEKTEAPWSTLSALQFKDCSLLVSVPAGLNTSTAHT